MSRTFIAGAVVILVMSAGAAHAQTDRTLPNGDVVTNQRSDINGTYNDQRTITSPKGAAVTNDRTIGNGRYSDTRRHQRGRR